jgi:hypothetical protein
LGWEGRCEAEERGGNGEGDGSEVMHGEVIGDVYENVRAGVLLVGIVEAASVYTAETM